MKQEAKAERVAQRRAKAKQDHVEILPSHGSKRKHARSCHVAQDQEELELILQVDEQHEQIPRSVRLQNSQQSVVQRLDLAHLQELTVGYNVPIYNRKLARGRIAELQAALSGKHEELKRSRSQHQENISKLQTKLSDGQIERTMLENRVKEQDTEIKVLSQQVESGGKPEHPRDPEAANAHRASVLNFLAQKKN